jgi:hypothetical protein
MEPGRGKWTFVGGFVNREETVAQAAVREVKEETGLDVELDGLVGVYDELVAGLFARKGAEKTGSTPFAEGASLHVPLLPDALAHIECLTNQIFISGDHAIVIGLVEEARTFEGQPLLYFARQYGTFSPL